VTVHFIWREADAAEGAKHRPILAALVGCVTYLGHSSSLVRASVHEEEAAIAATHEPAADGQQVFRVPSRGRLRELERDFARQARPSPGTYQPYREVGAAQPERPPDTSSVFGDMIVCRLYGPDLPLAGTLRLTTAVRDKLISLTNQSGDRVRELLSGHTPDGGYSRNDHVAYAPLANVGPHPYADGLIKGFALVLPHGLGRFNAERRAILRALVEIPEILFGAQGPWQVAIPQAGEELSSLRPRPYVGPADTWATVTPVLCDRFPKEKDGQRIEDVIRESCRRVLGIEPKGQGGIAVSPVSWHRGVPPSHAFGRIRKPGEPPRHRTHVLLQFDRKVRGPILLGAGRYAGLGLFRVLEKRRDGR
jgi:CRISPR-associated protein Csb2